MNEPAMVKDIKDAITGAEPMMKHEEMRGTLIELKGAEGQVSHCRIVG